MSSVQYRSDIRAHRAPTRHSREHEGPQTEEQRETARDSERSGPAGGRPDSEKPVGTWSRCSEGRSGEPQPQPAEATWPLPRGDVSCWEAERRRGGEEASSGRQRRESEPPSRRHGSTVASVYRVWEGPSKLSAQHGAASGQTAAVLTES